MPNALADETSPYLLQHKDNPVDWLPWGEEAFGRARAEGKPVLVSIGYSACHWCHVMERESFENEQIAALMNEHFVSVKVDREERPDVDAIYMEAVQAMTGRGGWPLNAFLTPDGVPFYAGTYFPPEPRHGMPSWPQLLTAIAREWRSDRDRIETQSARIRERLAGASALEPSGDAPDPVLFDRAIENLRGIYDHEYGGWGGAPKFPAASTIEFLLARGETEMSLATLRAMAAGGIYDQIGGGFARYSVDEFWLVPHFEKMLYDNALLARAYLHGWQVSGEPLLRRVATETLDWALRELRQPEGGFASALDADSEGVEGKFYVWTLDQVREVLGDDADEAIAAYGMTERGNFEGANIPVLARKGSVPNLAAVAPATTARNGTDPFLAPELRQRLYDARAERVWPGLDDKRLTAWNALMISALADAGAVLEEPRYLDAARATAEFILRDMRDGEGRLLRSYNRGRAKIGAYLEDHAFLLEALLTLYEATFEQRWFDEAERLARTLVERFADPEHGGFFATAADGDPLLIARRKELEDTPIPSGASAAALGLLRLAALTGEAEWERHALGVIALLARIAPQHPIAFGHLLQAIDFHLSPTREVALVGDAAGVAALARTVRARRRPHLVLAARVTNGPAAAPEAATPTAAPPLLAGREPVEGRAAAYVCERFACQRPVTTPDELEALLRESPGSAPSPTA